MAAPAAPVPIEVLRCRLDRLFAEWLFRPRDDEAPAIPPTTQAAHQPPPQTVEPPPDDRDGA
jgi:hypothetical protein